MSHLAAPVVYRAYCRETEERAQKQPGGRERRRRQRWGSMITITRGEGAKS